MLLWVGEASFVRISRARCLGVVAKTNEAARFVQARGFAPVHVIPCGYDETRFFTSDPQERDRCRNRLGLAANELVLVYAGKLLAVRDVGSAIQALAILQHAGKSVRLLVAGRGPELDALKKQALELGVEANVSFLGLLPWMQLRDAYWAGDVFVFPSHYEIFGLVLLEAMACGMVVISTPVPAAKDIISTGQNGYVVPIGDPQALADVLGRIADDPSGLTDLRKAASQVVQDYTWPVVAERIVDFAVGLGT